MPSTEKLEADCLSSYKSGLEQGLFEPKPVYCMGCPLYDQPGIVQGFGPQDAEIMEVGEAPGRDEVYGVVFYDKDRKPSKREMRPYIGGAGNVRRVWHRQTGIDTSKVFVTNTVKCRPPFNRNPTEDEIRHCAPFLAKEVARVKPKLIISYGAIPLYVLTGRQGIGRFHGLPLPGPKRDDDSEIKVLPVYHQAFIMRTQESWPIAVHDLAKWKTEIQFPEIRRLPLDLNPNATAEADGERILESARRAGFITFDWEAHEILKQKGRLNLGTGYIVCVGLGSEPHRADSFDWTPSTQSLCRTLFLDPSIEKVTQNGEVFDIPYAEQRGFEFAGDSFDTLQAFHLVNSNLPKNLESINSWYNDMEPWKNESMYKSGFAALKLGNCKDVVATTSSRNGLKAELKEYGMEGLYQTVMHLQPVLRKMHNRGMKKNEEKAFRWGIGLQKAAKEIEDKLHNVLGHSINLDSPKDLMRLLYDQMGLPIQYVKDKQRGMRPTVNAAALDKLAEITDNKIFQLIHKRRTYLKYDSTYLQVEADENSLVHPRVVTAAAADQGDKQSGARNGRLACKAPNAQNVPLELREVYEPDTKEHIFIEGDWSQIEWRNAMVQSGDETGLRLLTSGVDNHSAIAAECYNLSLDEVTALDRKFEGGHGSPRFASKFIVYGLSYGRGAEDISKQLKKDKSWVDDFVRSFAKKFSRYWESRREQEK